MAGQTPWGRKFSVPTFSKKKKAPHMGTPFHFKLYLPKPAQHRAEFAQSATPRTRAAVLHRRGVQPPPRCAICLGCNPRGRELSSCTGAAFSRRPDARLAWGAAPADCALTASREGSKRSARTRDSPGVQLPPRTRAVVLHRRGVQPPPRCATRPECNSPRLGCSVTLLTSLGTSGIDGSG